MPRDSQRRALRFESIDQMFAEVELLKAAESNGTLRSGGHWTLGQSLNHLAAWVDYGFEGAPIKIPFLIRKLAPLMKSECWPVHSKPECDCPGLPAGRWRPRWSPPMWPSLGCARRSRGCPARLQRSRIHCSGRSATANGSRCTSATRNCTFRFCRQVEYLVHPGQLAGSGSQTDSPASQPMLQAPWKL